MPTITARNFVSKCFEFIDEKFQGVTSCLRFYGEKGENDLEKEFDALLARARQEAREKAIEECLKLLSDNGVNNYRYDSEGHDWKEIFEKIEQLKSLNN